VCVKKELNLDSNHVAAYSQIDPSGFRSKDRSCLRASRRLKLHGFVFLTILETHAHFLSFVFFPFTIHLSIYLNIFAFFTENSAVAD
jgi:hypothetical protein